MNASSPSSSDFGKCSLMMSLTDRSRVTIRVHYSLPFGILGKLADHLGVERRSAAELDELLNNLRAAVEPQAGARKSASPD